MSDNEQQIAEVEFEFVPNQTMEAVFQITQNIQDLNYVHYQDVPSASWNITHNLGKYPSVTIINSAGDTVMSDITYVNKNQIQINFSNAFAGTAYIN